MNTETQNGIQVIGRASSILRVLAKNPMGMSLGRIAETVGIPRSTVQRIVKALEEEELVTVSDSGHGFILGMAFGKLMHQTQVDIVSIIHPHIQGLSQACNETVVLSSISTEQSNVIDRIVAERELRVVSSLGEVHALYTTVDGKLLLAGMSSEREVRDRLGDDYPKFTENTKTMSALLTDLAEIKKTGFAIDREENTLGISAVAVSINTYMGTYAIAIVTPSCRFDQNLQIFKSRLLSVKANIELSIGHS